MKTQMPEPTGQFDTSGENGYTEPQLRAAMVAAYNESIEEAAKVCDNFNYGQSPMWIQAEILKLTEQTP